MFLGLAKNATAFTGVTVGGTPTGSFASVTAGTVVTWMPFGWMPSTTPVNDLWSFVFSGLTYSFDLNNIMVDFQSNTILSLSGSGVLDISGAGYSPTAGDWAFSINKAGGGKNATFNFTFSNSQTAAVPEGGLTIAFLGSALLGLGMLRRRLS